MLYQNGKELAILLKSYISFAVIVLVFIHRWVSLGFVKSTSGLDHICGDNSLEIAQIETRMKSKNVSKMLTGYLAVRQSSSSTD